MSDHIVSADEARERLADLEKVESQWHGTGDSFQAAAMRTIIRQHVLVDTLRVTIDQQAKQISQQDAQIQRLHNEIAKLRDHARILRGHDSTALDLDRILTGQPMTIDTAADMEEQ